MGFAAINHFNRVSMSVAGNGIMEEYGIPPEQMGWVYFAFLIAYTATMTPGGWLIDSVGPRLALAIMGFGSAVFVALTGLAGTPLLGAKLLLALVVCRFFAGMLSADPSRRGADGIVWVAPPAQGVANGLVNGAALLGIAATYKLFGDMIDYYGWHGAFGIAGVGTALWTAWWFLHVTDRPSQHPAANSQEVALIEGDAMAAAKQAGGQFTLGWMFPPSKPQPGAAHRQLCGGRLLRVSVLLLDGVLLQERAPVEHGRRPSVFERRLAGDGRRHVPGAGSPTGRSAAMAAGSAALAPVSGMLASAVLLALGVSTLEPLLVISCFALAMAAIGTTEGPYWTTAVELGGRRGGTSAALFNTGGNVGGLLAPVVTPYIGKYLHWQGGVAVAGLLCVLGAALWFGIDPAERIDETEAAPSLPS